MQYIYIFFTTIITCLCIYIYILYNQKSDLEIKNYKLNEDLIQTEISLSLEQEKTKIMSKMNTEIQKDMKLLQEKTEKSSYKKVYVNNCQYKIYDLNKTKGIPLYIGTIGK